MKKIIIPSILIISAIVISYLFIWSTNDIKVKYFHPEETKESTFPEVPDDPHAKG